MINPGDMVRLKDRLWLVHGVVTRVNWSNQAEVRWDGPQKVTLMHDLTDLIKVDYNRDQLESVHDLIPQLKNMTHVWSDGAWKIAKPLASDDLKFWTKIKNAWLVLTGRAFVVRWY